MNTPHQPKPSNASKPANSYNDSDNSIDNDEISPEEIFPQAESAIGRAQRVVPDWDYEAYPDGRIPYC